LDLFAEIARAEDEQSWSITGAPPAGSTALDRVHQAMIRFGAGRAEALKPAVRAVDIFGRDEDIAAVALEQWPPAGGPDPVGQQGAQEIAEGAEPGSYTQLTRPTHYPV